MEFQELKNWSEEFLKKHSKQVGHGKIFSWWKEIVGPKIDSVSQPVYFKNHILFVEVKEQSWQVELGYHIPTILNKYQQKFSQKKITNIEIKNIRFKYNPNMQKVAYLKKLNDKIAVPNFNKSSHSSETQGGSIEERLEKVLQRFKDYALGKTPQSPTPKPRPSSKLSSSPQKTTSIAPSYNQRWKINLFYPEVGMYSEFISPSDELQNFDLY